MNLRLEWIGMFVFVFGTYAFRVNKPVQYKSNKVNIYSSACMIYHFDSKLSLQNLLKKSKIFSTNIIFLLTLFSSVNNLDKIDGNRMTVSPE